jgi:hypothetical protein
LYGKSTIRLLIVFALAFSLATIQGPLLTKFGFHTTQLVQATQVLNSPWLPAGPAMDKLTTPIFVDQVAEFNSLQQGTPPGSSSSIDLTDQQLVPSLISSFASSSQFLVTPTIREHAYYEVEFLLSNTFWNCNFNFGNSTCGIHIRQGIAHLIDKQAFVANDPSILTTAVAIDNPVPIDNGGLTTPDACGWDLLYSQTGSNCVVGSTDPIGPQYTGGSAYRLAPTPFFGSTGSQPNPSLDFCAAAGHFIAAGVATGVVTPPGLHSNWYLSSPSKWNITSSSNCQLTGIVSGTTPNFYIRKDDPKRLDLGNILAGQICLLFTGSSTIPCANLTVQLGFFSPPFPCPGLSCPSPPLSNDWWFYTASFVGVFPFDSSLYYIYNSRFVSGFPSIQPPCSSQSTGSFTPANYMYLCDPSYDNVSSQIETATCVRSALSNDIDTQIGRVVPIFRDCQGKTVPPSSAPLTSLSAAYQAEDRFGRKAYTLPLFNSLDNFAYLNNGFNRVINSNPGEAVNSNTPGISNYYTWLDAWNPNPPAPGTIRQGFTGTTQSLSPYIAASAHDSQILSSIYDELGRVNPYRPDQLLNWMTISTNLLCNSPPSCTSALTYAPPNGTSATYRFTLRSDVFFHDGRKATSFDVAFSYLSLLASGAYQSAGASSILGITLLSPAQFDFNLRSNSLSELFYLMGPSIMPGRYWTSVGSSAWDTASVACILDPNCFPAQYGINFGLIGSSGIPTVVCKAGTGLTSCPFSANNMNVDGTKIGATFDPMASGILIGSGPWMCVSSTGVRGQGCSPTGKQNPDPNTTGYTLNRFGIGHDSGSSLTDSYFRSSGTVALWFWSGNIGDFGQDFLNFGVVARCVGVAVGAAGCTHWQQGIGGEFNGSPTIVQAIPQASIVARLVGVDMVSVAADLVMGPNPTSPWTQTAIPMLAVGTANSFDGFPAPVLYEGTRILNPASAAGCGTGYPVGGYDC